MDQINFEILEDGTITVKTSDISDGNHMNADALMKCLDELMGGKVDIKDNPDAQRKAHDHKHAHAGHRH
jgi:hypothetical protein